MVHYFIYDRHFHRDLFLTNPPTGCAFLRWFGDIESTANPVTVNVDAPMHVVAEFVEVSAAISLDLVADLNALLTEAGESTADMAFDEGNGNIPPTPLRRGAWNRCGGDDGVRGGVGECGVQPRAERRDGVSERVCGVGREPNAGGGRSSRRIGGARYCALA